MHPIMMNQDSIIFCIYVKLLVLVAVELLKANFLSIIDTALYRVQWNTKPRTT
jgi:hypothetical protein